MIGFSTAVPDSVIGAAAYRSESSSLSVPQPSSITGNGWKSLPAGYGISYAASVLKKVAVIPYISIDSYSILSRHAIMLFIGPYCSSLSLSAALLGCSTGHLGGISMQLFV